MKRETGLVGRKHRTILYTWKCLLDQYDNVSFPFEDAFGCGASMKTLKGQKFIFTKQYKFSTQFGGKLTAPGAEISSGFGAEASETLVYEHTAASEWSYTSRPCEFCHPRIHYPNARITVWEKNPLHVPIFVSRQIQFQPGGKGEIRSHCRHDPGKCGKDCAETPAPAGRGSVLTLSETGGTTRVERVIFAERRRAHFSPMSGFDLRMLVSQNDVSGIPTEGKSLIVVAEVDNMLHFRIFDGDGKRVVDTDETRLPEKARQIKDLRERMRGELREMTESMERMTERMTESVRRMMEREGMSMGGPREPMESMGGPREPMESMGGPRELDLALVDKTLLAIAVKSIVGYTSRNLLDEIVTTPDDEAVPEQIYLPELRGRFRSVGGPVGRYCLYSMDDVDRALGAVRLFPNFTNRLYFLTKEPAECPPQQNLPHIEIYDEDNDNILEGFNVVDIRHGRFRLIETDLLLQSASSEEFMGPLKLRVRSGDTTDEWPAVLFFEESC